MTEKIELNTNNSVESFNNDPEKIKNTIKGLGDALAYDVLTEEEAKDIRRILDNLEARLKDMEKGNNI